MKTKPRERTRTTGLLPAVLRNRFEGEVPVNEWLVLYIFLEPNKVTDFRMFVDTCRSMLRPSSWS